MAAPNNVTAAPTPTNSVLLIALRKKNAHANTMSTMPIVKMNSARPRRLQRASRMPAHYISVSASSTYNSGNNHGNLPSLEPRLRLRYSSGAISFC